MEIGKSHRLGMELIHMGCLDNRVPMSPNVAITLIVGDNQNDVGTVRCD